MNANDRKRLGYYVAQNLLVTVLAFDKVKTKPWIYPIGAYLIFGSSTALANFYQTRRFVIDERRNYSDIAKFVVATAWLVYCNVRFFTS